MGSHDGGIRWSQGNGVALQPAVLQASSVRAKPIILTGLAVALIFGILVSTLPTLLLIPVMYFAFLSKR